MKLIVGLGNPGKKHEHTRHNIGFIVLDMIQKTLQAPDFRLEKKFDAEVAAIEQSSERIILAKPHSFMNQSGQPVQHIVGFYKLLSEDLWVVHDEIDLPLGTIRISKNVSPAGHHGIESIVQHLGTQDFIRFRVGIASNTMPKETTNYVLAKFAKDEWLQPATKTVQSIEEALRNGVESAMNQYN